jgi:hypothetical protein
VKTYTVIMLYPLDGYDEPETFTARVKAKCAASAEMKAVAEAENVNDGMDGFQVLAIIKGRVKFA